MIAVAQMSNTPEVPTRKRKFTTYVLPEIAQLIDQLVITEGRTESQMVNSLLQDSLIARGMVTREQIEDWAQRFKQS